MTWKDVNGIVSRALLELYGTVNFYALKAAFADFCSHLTYWHYAYTDTCTKWHFMHLAAQMFTIIQTLCVTILPQAVDVVIQRLEPEDILEPRGLLQTIYELVLVGNRFSTYDDIVHFLQTVMSTESTDDAFFAQEPLAMRLWSIRDSVLFDFAFEVVNVRFNKPITNPMQTNTWDDDQQTQETQLQRPMPKPMRKLSPQKQPAMQVQLLRSDLLRQWLSSVDRKKENWIEDTTRVQLLNKCGCSIQMLSRALHDTRGLPRVRNIRKSRVLHAMEYNYKIESPETEVWQFKILSNLHKIGVTLADVANYIDAKPKLPSRTWRHLFVALFATKLIRAQKAKQQQSRVLCRNDETKVQEEPCIQVGSAFRIALLVSKLLTQVHKKRQLKITKRQNKKERAQAIKKQRNLFLLQQHKTQVVFREQVLPQLLSKFMVTKAQSPTNTCNRKQQVRNKITKTKPALTVEDKSLEITTPVYIHRSKHTTAGIIVFWRKLGRLQAIKRALLTTPKFVSTMMDKVDDNRVREYLFGTIDSEGNTLYWEFRYALLMLTKVHAECRKIISHLLPISPYAVHKGNLSTYQELVATLINPFKGSAAIAITISIEPMIKLAKRLADGEIVNDVRNWIGKDPKIGMYHSCVQLFQAEIDVFTNMLRCFRKIPHSFHKILYSFYYAAPSHIDPKNVYIYRNCKDLYPRFKHIWVNVQSVSFGAHIDQWLETGQDYRLFDYLQLIADTDAFVAQIETEKQQPPAYHTPVKPGLKLKLRQRIEEMRHR